MDVKVKHTNCKSVEISWAPRETLLVSNVKLRWREVSMGDDAVLALETDYLCRELSPGESTSATLTPLKDNATYAYRLSFVCWGINFCKTSKFRTFYGVEELQKLLNKAVAHLNRESHEFKNIKVFYRRKPEDYYKPIDKSKLEAAYKKDQNGSRCSPINDTLKGLFFSATTKSGEPEPSSPFGNTELTIQVENLLHSQSKLYFCDFYCNDNGTRRRQGVYKTQHYVTLVLSPQINTETDRFCMEHLLPLNMENNDFLRLDKTGKVSLNHCDRLRVEIFYLGDIDITANEGKFRWNLPTFGPGSSAVNGRPKNTACAICNI